MSVFDRIRDALAGPLAGGEDELGREDLLRRLEEGLLALKRHGPRGREVFPAGVRVVVTVAEGSLATVRAFVADPSFERDLEARLQNRLVSADVLPARRYLVQKGDATRVELLEEDRHVGAVLVVEGGDRDGDRWPVELGRREWRIGRGKWHQERPDDQRLPNDVVLTETTAWISRAAAIVRRAGAFLEVEARQQGDFLVVVRRDGTQVRPAMTAAGRVPLAAGDRLVFHDGGEGRVVLRVDPPEEPC